MCVLVADQVSLDRTRGMSSIMGFIHDHLRPAGHGVDYLGADDVPDSRQGWLGRRFGVSFLLRRAAVTAARREALERYTRGRVSVPVTQVYEELCARHVR